MNKKLLPMLALPVLLGACNHIIVTQLPQTPPPVRVADQDSKWGRHPAYDAKGQYLVLASPRIQIAQRADGVRRSGTAIADLLVNRDGTVEDVAVVASSGDDVVDRTAIALCRRSRYSLRLGRDDPAPHIVRHVVLNGFVSVAEGPTYTYADIDRWEPHPTTENNNMGTSNMVNGWFR